jgi:SpoVK/Ycf46/Vps4 family AAA+-type ATPase/ribosomal protein L40E
MRPLKEIDIISKNEWICGTCNTRNKIEIEICGKCGKTFGASGMSVESRHNNIDLKIKNIDLKIKAELKRAVDLEKSLTELNELTGLEKVKEEVDTMVNLIKIKKLRESRGLQQAPMSLHLVFSGNPGTGKTTVARILGEIYCALGVLSKGHFIEVDQSGLIAGYVGQTALKTLDVINKAMGGILFIDEAYSLAKENRENEFGYEAIETLIKAMEDHRNDFIVIIAGYPELMLHFLKANPGLESRFNTTIHFEDYSFKELADIFIGFCKKNQYTISEEAEIYLINYFKYICENKQENFSNARKARNLFENAVKKQANRLALNKNIADRELLEITVDDLK